MNWIRIAVGIADDPDIHRIAAQVDTSDAATVGHVVAVLVQLPTHAVDGDLRDVPDSLLERWALWTGPRGVFATAFRQHLCTPDGVVRSWEKHNGGALREAKRSKERAKQWRESKANPDDADRERVRKPFANAYEHRSRTRSKTVPNGNRTIYETLRDDTTPSADAAGVVRARETNLTDAAAAGANTNSDPESNTATGGHDPIAQVAVATRAVPHADAVAGAIRAAPHPQALAGELLAMAEGMRGAAVPWPLVCRAVHELQVAGGRMTPASLRGFVRRLQAGDIPPPEDTSQAAWDAAARRLGVILA